MDTDSSLELGSAILDELIRLLHRDAPVDDLVRAAARVEGSSDVAALAQLLVDVRKRLDAQHQRERGLLSVIESAQDLASRLDLADVLNAIVTRARNLVGSDAGWLSIFDEVRGEFRVAVADGVFARRTREMWTSRDRGVAGLVMSTRLPFATTNYLADPHFAHDPQLDETFREEGIVSLVGVPLIWSGDVIGLLFVADRYHHTHSAQSMAILCALATHGALALRNARDFERANAALERADAIRGELESHAKSVQEATDAHERLTSLLARGASLATLCQTVAQLLDGDVLVLDEAGQVVSQGAPDASETRGAEAFSPQGRRGGEIAHALGTSRRTGRSVVAYESDGETCRAMSVIGGTDVLGAIVLVHRGARPEIAIRTFERAASIVGIVLLSQERVEAANSGSVAALLQSLVAIRQDDPALLADRASRHGLDLGAPLSLTLIDRDGPGLGHVARRLRMLPAFAQMLVDEIDGHLVVLCAATKAVDLHRTITTGLRADLGDGYRGVQSRPFVGAAQIAPTFARFKRALTVLERLGARGRLVGENDLTLYATLFETHDRATLDAFLEATIGPLVAYDAKRKTQLAATLLQVFDSQQNARVAAERLRIHVNTVRQRLATIESLVGSWGNASRALELHMALRLWSLREPPPAS